MNDAGDAGEVCDRLEWDSAFFGVPIARVRANRLTGELASAIDGWAEAHAIRCLYFLADLAHMPTVRLAEEHGYRLVDIKVTYEARIAELQRVVPQAKMPAIRIAVPEDIPAFREMARHSYPGTRFYNDPGFPDAAVRRAVCHLDGAQRAGLPGRLCLCARAGRLAVRLRDLSSRRPHGAVERAP